MSHYVISGVFHSHKPITNSIPFDLLDTICFLAIVKSKLPMSAKVGSLCSLAGYLMLIMLFCRNADLIS